MQGKVKQVSAAGRYLTVYLPPAQSGERLPVAYLNDGEELAEMLEELAAFIERELAAGRCRPFLLVGVPSSGRDSEYTPWPSSAVFSGGPDYAGGAGDYLRLLESGVKPLIDRLFPTLPAPEETALCGYSLGGLCAAYAAYVSAAFGRVASVSGSLWYPGWMEYAERSRPGRPLHSLWISLGKKEAKARPPLSAGEEAALLTWKRLAPSAQRHTFVWHEGGHFSQIAQRQAQALCWLFETADIAQ